MYNINNQGQLVTTQLPNSFINVSLQPARHPARESPDKDVKRNPPKTLSFQGTVDGSEIRRSSVDMVNIPLGNKVVVGDVFHQQYLKLATLPAKQPRILDIFKT